MNTRAAGQCNGAGPIACGYRVAAGCLRCHADCAWTSERRNDVICPVHSRRRESLSPSPHSKAHSRTHFGGCIVRCHVVPGP